MIIFAFINPACQIMITIGWNLTWTRPVTSPGFVARRGKDGNYVMGHSRWTSGPGAAAARWLIVLWLMSYATVHSKWS